MKKLFAVFVLAIFFIDYAVSQHTNDCPAPSGQRTRRYGDYCYLFETGQSKLYKDANAYCRDRTNGVLALSKNKAINNFLTESLNHLRIIDTPLWIGLDDMETEKTFKWLDGTKATYTNFAQGFGPDIWDPYKDCSAMKNDGKWYDQVCSHKLLAFRNKKLGFICQYFRPTTTTSTTTTTTTHKTTTRETTTTAQTSTRTTTTTPLTNSPTTTIMTKSSTTTLQATTRSETTPALKKTTSITTGHKSTILTTIVTSLKSTPTRPKSTILTTIATSTKSSSIRSTDSATTTSKTAKEATTPANITSPTPKTFTTKRATTSAGSTTTTTPSTTTKNATTSAETPTTSTPSTTTKSATTTTAGTRKSTSAAPVTHPWPFTTNCYQRCEGMSCGIIGFQTDPDTGCPTCKCREISEEDEDYYNYVYNLY